MCHKLEKLFTQACVFSLFLHFLKLQSRSLSIFLSLAPRNLHQTIESLKKIENVKPQQVLTRHQKFRDSKKINCANLVKIDKP